MPQIKLNKHQVYTYIADNLDWFRGKGDLRYLSCYSIGKRINALLSKDGCAEDAPYIKLSGATMTAMVYDGVMEREFVEAARCYAYRPLLPIVEDYKEKSR